MTPRVWRWIMALEVIVPALLWIAVWLNGDSFARLVVGEVPLALEYAWGGDHRTGPVKMLPRDEGFCFLVGLERRTGVPSRPLPMEVVIEECEGHWWLRGVADRQQQARHTARARCWRYPRLLQRAAAPRTDAEHRTCPGTLPRH